MSVTRVKKTQWRLMCFYAVILSPGAPWEGVRTLWGDVVLCHYHLR